MTKRARDEQKRPPRWTSALPSIRTLALAFVALAAGFAFCSAHFSGTAPTVVMQVLLSVAGFAGAAVAWNRNDRRTLVTIVVAAVVVRCFLLPLTPVHSNDAYRYLWDGRDLIRGIDPYDTLPSSLMLWHKDWLYAHIDWTEVPTLYPPLDLALYALAARLDAHHLLGIKSVLLAGDLGTIGVLVIGLRHAKLPAGRVAVYAWNPIVVTEFALGGHEEAWAVFWIVAALVALRAERVAASAVSLAAAVLTKLYPLAFVPVFFAVRRSWWAAALALVAIVVAYLPFIGWIAGPLSPGRPEDVFGFLKSFAYGYNFNDSLHEAIGTGGAAVVFGATVGAAVLARRRGARLAGLIFILELAYLACSPNVFPWYTTIFPALAPLVPYAFDGPWRPLTVGTLVWSALSPLSYTDRWVFEPFGFWDTAVHVFEYLPLYAGIGGSLLYLWRHDRERTFAAVRHSARSLVPRRPPFAMPSAVRPQPARAPRADLRLDALPDRSRLPEDAKS